MTIWPHPTVPIISDDRFFPAAIQRGIEDVLRIFIARNVVDACATPSEHCVLAEPLSHSMSQKTGISQPSAVGSVVRRFDFAWECEIALHAMWRHRLFSSALEVLQRAGCPRSKRRNTHEFGLSPVGVGAKYCSAGISRNAVAIEET